MRKPIVAACIALFFYGSWAAYANWSFGFNVASIAFIIQGCFAFLSTYLSGKAALYLLFKLQAYKYSAVWTFMIIMSLLCLTPLILHSVFLTPNKLLAMAPGLIFGSIYIGFIVRIQSVFLLVGRERWWAR